MPDSVQLVFPDSEGGALALTLTPSQVRAVITVLGLQINNTDIIGYTDEKLERMIEYLKNE